MDEKTVFQAAIIIILIVAAPAIAYAAAQISALYVKQGPYLVESAKTFCSLEDRAVDSLIEAVEKNVKNNERVDKIISLYKETGDITECDIKQLLDILDPEERKKLNLPDVVCNALNCVSK